MAQQVLAVGTGGPVIPLPQPVDATDGRGSSGDAGRGRRRQATGHPPALDALEGDRSGPVPGGPADFTPVRTGAPISNRM